MQNNTSTENNIFNPTIKFDQNEIIDVLELAHEKTLWFLNREYRGICEIVVNYISGNDLLKSKEIFQEFVSSIKKEIKQLKPIQDKINDLKKIKFRIIRLTKLPMLIDNNKNQTKALQNRLEYLKQNHNQVDYLDQNHNQVEYQIAAFKETQKHIDRLKSNVQLNEDSLVSYHNDQKNMPNSIKEINLVLAKYGLPLKNNNSEKEIKDQIEELEAIKKQIKNEITLLEEYGKTHILKQKGGMEKMIKYFTTTPKDSNIPDILSGENFEDFQNKIQNIPSNIYYKLGINNLEENETKILPVHSVIVYKDADNLKYFDPKFGLYENISVKDLQSLLDKSRTEMNIPENHGCMYGDNIKYLSSEFSELITKVKESREHRTHNYSSKSLSSQENHLSTFVEKVLKDKDSPKGMEK